MVGSDRPYDNKLRRMRIACWITKATDTNSEYAFTWQKWFCFSMLRLYIHCMSCSFVYLSQYYVFNHHIYKGCRKFIPSVRRHASHFTSKLFIVYVAQLIEALRYKPEGPGFDSR